MSRSSLPARPVPSRPGLLHGLREIHRGWIGTTWFLEGDISSCFDSLDHTVLLLSILAEKIHDGRFLRLVAQACSRPDTWEATEFLGRRLRQLANERDKLLRANYADAIDVATVKREQGRINAEVAGAESDLASDGEKLAQAKQIIDLALDLTKDCATSYRKARPDVRKMWNRAFFKTMRVRDGAIADFT